jgi:hypothetical protein
MTDMIIKKTGGGSLLFEGPLMHFARVVASKLGDSEKESLQHVLQQICQELEE